MTCDQLLCLLGLFKKTKGLFSANKAIDDNVWTESVQFWRTQGFIDRKGNVTEAGECYVANLLQPSRSFVLVEFLFNGNLLTQMNLPLAPRIGDDVIVRDKWYRVENVIHKINGDITGSSVQGITLILGKHDG